MVSDEEPEVQVKRERPRTRHDLEDNLGCDEIDNYENTSPHCYKAATGIRPAKPRCILGYRASSYGR